jgi:hypothetical protein
MGHCTVACLRRVSVRRARIRRGSGVALAWLWRGSGVALAWLWRGSGVARATTRCRRRCAPWRLLERVHPLRMRSGAVRVPSGAVWQAFASRWCSGLLNSGAAHFCAQHLAPPRHVDFAGRAAHKLGRVQGLPCAPSSVISYRMTAPERHPNGTRTAPDGTQTAPERHRTAPKRLKVCRRTTPEPHQSHARATPELRQSHARATPEPRRSRSRATAEPRRSHSRATAEPQPGTEPTDDGSHW